MAKVLVTYHSMTGNTEKMAQSVSDGAKSAGAEVILKKAADTTAEDILACDGVAFGSPLYFGYMAGALKDLFDRAFFSIRGKVSDKPYVSFSSAGRGGSEALGAIDAICSSLKLKKVTEGVVAAGEISPEALGKCVELGKKLTSCCS